MRYLAVLSLLFSLPGAAQNLLMNGSFEDENICTEYIKNCAPEGWISTSLWGDYYFNDPPNAYDQEHFVGLMYSTGTRTTNTKAYKFIRSRILCGLRAGALYRLEFYIRSFHSRLDSVGVYFSTDDILFRRTPMNTETPQPWVKDALPSSPTNEWQRVSLLYTASGQENFIAIGDFRTSASTFSRRPDIGDQFYYFIDNISLLPLNPAEHICDSADAIRQEEYDFNPRHTMLDKLIYARRKNPPPITPASKTIVQRVDTLVIPDVLFATNSSVLTKASNNVLDSFIRKAAHYQTDSLVVEGHTDSTGSIPLNQKLSQARATSVASYLQPHFQPLIVTRGWASDKPVADNRTASGRQKNRRVEIYLYLRE